jgi:hypothetical protein
MARASSRDKRPLRGQRLIFIGLALGALGLTGFCFRSVDRAPLVWSALAWAALAFWAWLGREPGRRGGAWLNVAALWLAVAFGEGFLWIRAANSVLFGPEFSFEGSYYEPNGFFIKPDTTLGYRPRPGAEARAIKKHAGQIVYDVEYHVGADGLRRAPPTSSKNPGCVLFFGDSFAWGEGVADTETSAYQLGLLTGGDYRVYNFAVTGYSAHQFAAQLEQGVVRKAIDCERTRPVQVVYEVLPNNVGRSAGLGAWDNYGPRYVLDRNGALVRRGYFSRGDYILHDRLLVPLHTLRYVGKTLLYEHTFGRSRRPDDFDLQRFVKLLDRGRSVLQEQLPQARLLLILFYDMDEDGGLGQRTRAMYAALKSAGFDVRLVGEAIPGYDADPLRFHIPRDGHLTPEAHRLVASYLAHELESVATRCQPLTLGSVEGLRGH